MQDEALQPADDEQAWSGPLSCLERLPGELLACIVRFCVASGRECDASALARTNKILYKDVNAELYNLVIKHKTFHLVHWAAMRNRTGTLKIAFAKGADPSQMWTSATLKQPCLEIRDHFRPLGWGLDTTERLVRAVWRQHLIVGNLPHHWGNLAGFALPYANIGLLSTPTGWFSSTSLSAMSEQQLKSLWRHYNSWANYNDGSALVRALQASQDSSAMTLSARIYHIVPVNWAGYADEQQNLPYDPDLEANDSRLNVLSSPPDDDFTFPTELSPKVMNKRETKLAYVRLFQYWHTPLHAAARLDSREAARVLLNNGADVDATSAGACTCSKEMLLPRAWMRSNETDVDEPVVVTPLHIAMCNRNYNTAKLLMEHGASRLAKLFRNDVYPHWTDENPLHASLHHWYMRQHFSLDFIEFVLNHGYAARIEERNNDDLTPLMLACDAREDPRQEEVMKLLVQYGADPNNMCAVAPRQLDEYDSLQMERYEIDRATPLIWAARQGDYRAAWVLLDLGANPMKVSSSLKSSALHAVCSPATSVRPCMFAGEYQINLLDGLLAKATVKNVNQFDAAGNTPLMDVITWKFSGRLEVDTRNIESRLFKKGADILAGLGQGKTTPLEHAVQKSVWCYHISYSQNDRRHSVIGDRMLYLLRASKVNYHSRRPRAFLNRFWDILDSVEGLPWTTHYNAPSVLHALIRAGFSPRETDQNGDTAMISFLRHLRTRPKWATYNSKPLSIQQSLILSIIAVLQENGAALRTRNKNGLNAFDYLEIITEYNGARDEQFAFAQAIKALVKPGYDEHGNLVFKYHPTTVMFGALGGLDLPSQLRAQRSKWLFCEHWCRVRCHAYVRCECASGPSQTIADCSPHLCV